MATLGFVIGFGPRAHVDEGSVRLAIEPPPHDLRALSAWLAAREREAGVTDTAVAARVLFATGDTAPTRTAWSVVYLHGFSATRQETAPLAEEVARQLGANLFETRLAGHGLPGDSLGTATAADWLRDARLALEAGRRLGDSVLVIGTSTGGTLGVWLATLPRAERLGLAALVLISPNFGPTDKAATVLTWPWAEQVLPRFIPHREWTPRNDEQARFWTVRYPSRALFPMQALVEHVRARPLDSYDVPTLVSYNPDDQVVDAGRTEAWLATLAPLTKAALRRVTITPAADEDGHVLAGRVVSPSQTAPMRDRIVAFVRSR
jgi:esterase/lipase